MGISWLGPTAMVLTAVAALGCVLTSRPRRAVAVVASTGMVVAMADTALGHLLLTPVAWAGVLVILGVFTVALPRPGDDHAAWHHGLALVAAAAIMMVSPHTLPTASAAGHDSHQSPTGVVGGWVLGLAIAVAYAVADRSPDQGAGSERLISETARTQPRPVIASTTQPRKTPR